MRVLKVMSQYSMLNGKQVVAAVCYQWGDSGKGKVIDWLSGWADINARGTGGNNAGHTLVLNGQKYIFHLIPSSILKDNEGMISVMGNGMVDDLGVVNEELDSLDEGGCSYNGLRISDKATLILPHHKQLDSRQSGMGKGEIGTTGRGIGPAYADRTARYDIKLGDLLDIDRFVKQLKRVKEYYHHPDLNFKIDEIVEEQSRYFQRIKDFVCDTDRLLRQELAAGKRVSLEGAQGTLLSRIYGTDPFVTSSDSTKYGLAQGVGLLPEEIDLVLGIVKFPFMTRVGNGPFPTEYTSEWDGEGVSDSERYCAEDNGNAHKRPAEEREFGDRVDQMLNSSDSFERGRALRYRAGEYGATTERARRVGRTDLVALKYAARINGPDIVLTKPDCVRGMGEIELGTAYENDAGERKTEISHGSEIAYGWKGRYSKRFLGFDEDIRECESFSDLPGGLREAISYMEREAGVRARIVSLGPEANQMVFRS